MPNEEAFGMLNAVWPFILMAGIFYFMLYRPQKKEQQRRQDLLSSLKVGVEVVSIGCIYGVITAISDHKVTLKIAEGVNVEFTRSAVSSLQDTAK